MPIRPPCLTVRRLMIVVASVAVTIGGWIEANRLRRLSREYSKEASMHEFSEGLARSNGEQSHEDWEAHCREIEESNANGGVQDGGRLYALSFPSPPPAFQRKLAEYHRRLRLKYERAARYPWFAVEPDPPEPVWDWDDQP